MREEPTVVRAPGSAFGSQLDEFLAELFRLDPIRATDAGMHAHDDRWPDWTETGRLERLAFVDRWAARFRAIGDPELTLDERVDRDLALGELDAMRSADADLRQDAWDPLAWVEGIGIGLFLLIAREHAPLAERLTAFAGRLEGLPAVVDAAIGVLVGLPGVPVSRLHAETALSQLPGIGELIDEALGVADAATASDPGVAAIRPRLDAAADVARAAVERFGEHLTSTIIPASVGDGRLGPDRFRERFRHTLRDAELTPELVLERARREAEAVRAEMVRVARQLWPERIADRPPPADEAELVRTVLETVVREHPAAQDLLDRCRSELHRIEAFCREHAVIALPDEPLTIEWTPAFLRGFGGASLWSPGPLDRSLPALFLITPMPEDWSDDERESWLRELNDRQISLLTIHEATPGHYLQGVRANACPSIIRTVFGSGVFAEGWAVYVTQVILDAGFDAHDPAYRLIHWKFYLRAALNAVLDVRVHALGMTEEEAIELLVEGGFQEEAEARNKFKRARLTSAQLSTYFVGSMQLWDLEREVRRRAAAASGATGDIVPEPDLPGGLGSTPGFDQRAHLEDVIAHGTPPIPLLRRLVLRDRGASA
jgi:uncharacterized protein (DUF885 family)